jgi:hypothetical protein
VNHEWPEYVALALALVVIGGAFAVMVTDVIERRRARRPPERLGRKKERPPNQ